MARDRKRFSWRRVLLLLLPVLICAWWFLPTLEVRHPPGRPSVYCMSNLRQLGALMYVRLAEGRLERVPGSAFLKQFAMDIRDEDLEVFACPGDPRYPLAHDDQPWVVENTEELIKRYRADWRTAPCSYRGPDAELLAEAFRPDAPRLIIACDLNGPDGSTPYHSVGVVVVFNDGRVDFIKWEEMEGHAGGPVTVGPASPDPRFRRLIR